MKYLKLLEIKTLEIKIWINEVIFVIEQGGGGEEYGKDFPNFCVDYFMSEVWTGEFFFSVLSRTAIKQDLCFNEKFCSVKNSTCSMYLALINRHFLLSSFKWKQY